MFYKLSKNKRTRDDIVIMLIIVLSPFLFYLYNLVPENQIWETSLFTINAGYFENADYFVWLLFVKLLTIVILCLWFLTSHYSWKYVLIFPLFFEINKITIIIIESKINHIGEGNIICNSTILFSIPFFIILLWINDKLAYHKLNKSISHLLNEEILSESEKLSKFDVKLYKSIKLELKQIENQKNNLNRKQYLEKLILLRERLNNL